MCRASFWGHAITTATSTRRNSMYVQVSRSSLVKCCWASQKFCLKPRGPRQRGETVCLSPNPDPPFLPVCRLPSSDIWPMLPASLPASQPACLPFCLPACLLACLTDCLPPPRVVGANDRRRLSSPFATMLPARPATLFVGE